MLAKRAKVVVMAVLPMMAIIVLPGPDSRVPTALAPPDHVGPEAKPSSPVQDGGASPTSLPAASSSPTPTAAMTTRTPTASVTPAPTPTPGTPDTAMPIGDLTDANGTWHQIFTEDFTTAVPVGSFPGPVYRTKWGVYPDGRHDTTGNGTHYPSRVLSVSNGILNIYLHTEIINGIAVHMVAAPVPHMPGSTRPLGQAYGRYSVRFKADPVPGYKTAWLLWPDSGVWPGDGEIDFPEGDLAGTIYAFMHYANPAGGQEAFRTGVTYGGWHIATIEWWPGNVTFFLDGRVVGVSTTQVPVNPMHYVLQTETCLDCGAPSNAAAGNVQVDWVVIYSRA